MLLIVTLRARYPMKSNFYYFLLITIFSGVTVHAQLDNCTLGMGGPDTSVITQVFQLNDKQISQMDFWIGELGSQNKVIEDQIKELFDTHPQSTQDELIAMATKYKGLKDQLVAISLNYDRKLLGIFNEKQYQRYVELCAEALRQPLTPYTEEDTEPE